jgi:hypothetical protein
MLQPSARRLDVADVACVALVAAIVLGGAGVAAADVEPTGVEPTGPVEPTAPAAAALTWHAPPDGCPTEAGVMAEIAQNLAGSGGGLTSFRADVAVREPADGRWQASLQFQARDTRGERTFEAESCEAIASAAALVIALWAEGEIDASQPAAPSPPSPDRALPPAVPPVPEIALSTTVGPAAPGADPRRSGTFVTVNGLIDRNTMPVAPAEGVEVGVARIWSGSLWRLRALAGGSYFPMRLWNLPNNVRLANSQLYNVTTRGCFTVGDALLEIGPCAGVELAVMRSTGEPFHDRNQAWLSLLGGAVLAWKVSPVFAVVARGEVIRPTARKNVLVEDPGQTWVGYTVPAVAGRGALGIEMRFW